MDIIIKSYLQEFSENFGFLSQYTESDRFELFSIYCTLFNEYRLTSFNLHDVLTGKATQGIDGIAIIVNNKLCTSVKEIEDLVEMNKYLDATFIMIQSKISEKFSGADIGNFFDWSSQFFQDNNDLFTSENMKNFLDMKEYIYRNSKFMRNRSPICKLYYVTTGIWNNDKNLTSKVNNRIQELLTLNIFENNKVHFIPCGAEELRSLYRKTNEVSEVTIKFQKKTILSDIPDVKVAYYGLLPFSEFKKIIIDENDNIKAVFDENIRDYLETLSNPVNADMQKVLDSKKNIYFTLMNNGITVVCEDIIGPSDNITLKNYQIVNGCQTSHVLFHNRHLNIDNLDIPIKIISTDNHEIKSDITRATNNQTAVSIVELEALTIFQKKLEDYFIAMGNEIFYERRTNQYRNTSIEKHKIISIEMQVKIFSAMILDLPHTVSGNYGKLLKDLKTEIFNQEHNLKIYYVCSLVYSKLLDLYNKLFIIDKYWKFRFHILMIFKYLVTSQKTPNLKAKKEIDKYCDDLLNICKNEDNFKRMIRDAVDILILDMIKIDIIDRKSPELKSNTDMLYNYLKEGFSKFNNMSFKEDNKLENKSEEKVNILIQKSLFEL
jgi:hypothetical protein